MPWTLNRKSASTMIYQVYKNYKIAAEKYIYKKELLQRTHFYIEMMSLLILVASWTVLFLMVGVDKSVKQNLNHRPCEHSEYPGLHLPGAQYQSST